MTDKEPELVGELEATKLELAELKQAKETLLREIDAKNNTVASLEQTVASKDSEILSLKQAAGEFESKMAELEKALAQAVASYRALIIESNPGVLAELITGETVDEVNQSLKNAQRIIERVKQELETEAAKTKVPAGAPPRAPLELSVLSPREKIQYAIGGNK